MYKYSTSTLDSFFGISWSELYDASKNIFKKYSKYICDYYLKVYVYAIITYLYDY